MRFADVIGHEDVKQRLRDMVDSDRVPHALMLSGMPGLGKMRMARAFLQYLMCQDRHDGDSCGVCPVCRQVEALNYPDVHYVFPMVKRKSAGKVVCEDYTKEWRSFLSDHSYMPMRGWLEAMDAGNSQPYIYAEESGEVLRKLSLSSYAGRFKATVIWQPEKMNPAAANKLLKIIEEPYPDTVFIMVSDEPDLILPTIMSRTQRIGMLPLRPEEISEALVREYRLSPDTATAVARLADGSYLRAIENVDTHDEATQFRDIFQSVMRNAYARNVAELKRLSDDIAAMGRDKTRRYLAYMDAMLRENLIYNLGNPSLNLLTPEEQAFSSRFSPFVNMANVGPMNDAVCAASADIARNANSKIVCFDLMLSILVQIRRK